MLKMKKKYPKDEGNDKFNNDDSATRRNRYNNNVTVEDLVDVDRLRCCFCCYLRLTKVAFSALVTPSAIIGKGS